MRIAFRLPNGWRLNGDGGEADGVRCSRVLGGEQDSLPTVPQGLEDDVAGHEECDGEHNEK